MKAAMCASWSEMSCRASSTRTTTCASFDRLQRLDHRELLDRLEDLAAAPQTGGVDQAVAAAATLELDFDRIAGRSRLVEGDHPLLADEGVDHRALADVRPADDRHPDQSLSKLPPAAAQARAAAPVP
jgi:hypothetical protein